MTIQSKLTAQGQISIPAEIRKKLGIGPGSAIEWEERDGEVVVRRVGLHSSAAVHAAVFKGQSPPAKTLQQLKAGVRAHMRKKYARD
ncbi:MAG: AbrB/MazE/SpoVT family DNA-binding domain-containing protein [Alphaproteobacteria bacterium]|nr:AbrB/MazE/SpoVT family DNA-binding domain-containing protein [Alphaproteobacteria bacterium]